MKRICGWLLVAMLLGLGRAKADGIKVAGDILQYALPAATAAITMGSGDWDGTLQFAEAFAVQGLTVITLKNTIYETRPNGDGHQSFPSGHASVTFCSAEFLRERYGWTLGAPAYALAAFTGYSRVECDAHYWHDVAAGALIGIGSSWLFTSPGQKWNFSPSTDGKNWTLKFQRFW